MVVGKEIFETNGDGSGGGSGEADDPAEAICRKKKLVSSGSHNNGQSFTQTPRISNLES
jgi:hypothetical protein